MAYIDKKGNTVLLKGDRIILQEDHYNCWYTFHEGEEVEIVCASKDGDNYYAIKSLDGKARIDGAILGGLSDNSITIIHHAGTKKPDAKMQENIKTKRGKENIASEMLLFMVKNKEKQ